MRLYIPRPILSVAVQRRAMHELYRDFDCVYWGFGLGCYWTGPLATTPKSPIYTVKVLYNLWSVPKVYILEPEIHEHAPHRYRDKSLCLYYPRDGGWSPRKVIATTILPWTSEWLLYYELWLMTGEWFGDEAPHDEDKERKDVLSSA